MNIALQLILNEPLALTSTMRCDANPGGFTTPNISLGSAGNHYIATFTESFLIGTNYTFTLFAAADILGNIAPELTFTDQYIQYQIAAPGDVILNEILPDPTPIVGLPDVEYIEIFNRSNKYIDGNDLLFKDGTSAGVRLTGVLLSPGDFVVVTGVSGVPNFPQGIKIAGIPSLPTLNNDGESLTLLNVNGTLIDEIGYDLDWYKDVVKSAGGWSLERINPDAPCSGALNWTSSTSPSGGTPGLVNAVYNNSPDIAQPYLVGASAPTNF